MASVSIHAPKTPITKGSFGIAKATLPNICKMPGPPAPFVPTPLPNIGKSGDSPKGYSTSVKIEGHAVAIQGASFGSMGDIASKALGGGIVSMNTHGPTKFIGPGSLTVKIESKAVHLKAEPMFNNCGPSGSPPNSATMSGEDQAKAKAAAIEARCAELKRKFGIQLASHKENTTGKTKRTVSSKVAGQSQQSHHVFQDAALSGLVPRGSALAIMLANSFKNTEHGDITREQNSRTHNKARGGEAPGRTFGEIKKQAREDLVKGLQGKRQQKDPQNDNRTMNRKEAEDAADCIVAEAEEKAQEEARKNRKKLSDQTAVNQPGGCFASGTLVYLAGGELRPVEALRRGDFVRTTSGSVELYRVDRCRSGMIEVEVGETRLVLAPYHRLFCTSHRPTRADELRTGDMVETLNGLRAVRSVTALADSANNYRLGLAKAEACFVGEAGIAAELAYAGPPVMRSESVIGLDTQ